MLPNSLASRALPRMEFPAGDPTDRLVLADMLLDEGDIPSAAALRVRGPALFMKGSFVALPFVSDLVPPPPCPRVILEPLRPWVESARGCFVGPDTFHYFLYAQGGFGDFLDDMDSLYRISLDADSWAVRFVDGWSVGQLMSPPSPSAHVPLSPPFPDHGAFTHTLAFRGRAFNQVVSDRVTAALVVDVVTVRMLISRLGHFVAGDSLLSWGCVPWLSHPTGSHRREGSWMFGPWLAPNRVTLDAVTAFLERP